ncbi:flavin reductase family protein [Ornithinibacillus gellani]|uniref:flavin reductase family protein n=1 Tax=Ornithinibacillus gellani TaxID=2293253 RepID=UPI000F460A19|nr:flavin reductase family protein [Ornithinibacillus gellani]TQS74883.1 flavin reductase family protein [Ornithinibacillus gellani]
MNDHTFRTAMGKFATGVTVITTMIGEEAYGMTANAFMSVSLNPKLVLISIDENAHMNQYLQQSKKFAVSMLNADQQHMSAYFAGQIKEKQNIDFHWFQDMPTIKDAIAAITCEVDHAVVAGDHTLYIGRVTDLYLRDGEPLTFFEGKYRTIAPSVVK